jgi:hypothetical protein
MQNITDWSIAVFGALIVINLLMILAILSVISERQAERQAGHYEAIRRAFYSACRTYEDLPYYPWETGFPRLEPFAYIDTRVIQASEKAAAAIAAFPGPIALIEPGSRGLWSLLFDIPGNLSRMRRWHADNESIRGAERQTAQLKEAVETIAQLFQNEPAIRQAVIDSLAPLREQITDTAEKPRLVDAGRAGQIEALTGHALAVLDRAETATRAGVASSANKRDDGIRFSMAHLHTQIAGLFLRHVTLLDEINGENERVNEIPLLEQLDALYPESLRLSDLPVEPDWNVLDKARLQLAAHQPKLEAIARELQKQIDESAEYWESLNLFISEVDAEIRQVEMAETALAPYLGKLEDVPQAWEQVSGEVGRVSEKLKTLRHGLQGLARADGARRATAQNWTNFHEEKDRFLQLKGPSQALQEKMYELQRDQRKLQNRFEADGSAAQMILKLQKAAADSSPDTRSGLDQMVERFQDLKKRIKPHAGFNYQVINQRIDGLEAEARQVFKAYQDHLARRRAYAATARSSFEALRGRYLKLRDRKPRFEKDWSGIEQWINRLAGFNSSRASLREIDEFLSEYQRDAESCELELGKVEQLYGDFDLRVQGIVHRINDRRGSVARYSAELESSAWAKIFAASILALRSLSAECGQQVERAQAACSMARMDDAVAVLDQVEAKTAEIATQRDSVTGSYAGMFDDLNSKLSLYNKLREKFIASPKYSGPSSLGLAAADDYRDQALHALEYQTAREALQNAIRTFDNL